MSQTKKPCVLAVDDVSVVLNAVIDALHKDYDVYALSKARQVESFLKQHKPDLFILDIEMPELNGYDLINLIRSHEEHKETPVIFLTGNATVQNFHSARDYGVSDFIAKPVDSAALLQRVAAKIKK